MKVTCVIGVVAGLLIAAPAFAQKEVVENVKNALVAQGVNLTGNCGAFEIVKRVAWQLRGQGIGLVADSGGTQCLGYSTDVLQSNAGNFWVDMLAGAGDPGGNIPVWSVHTPVDLSVWRPAIDPGEGAPMPPIPPVVVPVPMFDWGAIVARFEQADSNNERRYLDLAARDAARYQQLIAMENRLLAEINEPGWFKKIVTNRYVQAIGALAVGYVTRITTDGK